MEIYCPIFNCEGILEQESKVADSSIDLNEVYIYRIRLKCSLCGTVQYMRLYPYR